jgi:hypothetical protein
LLWSAVPQFKGQIEVSGWTLEQTAVPLNTQGSNCGGDYVDGPNNDWGYGRLNILDAVTLAKSNLTLGWFTVDPMYGTVNAGDSADLNLAFTAPEDPGVYTATLMVVGDDPYNPDIRIPLSMTVEQTEFMILLPLLGK